MVEALNDLQEKTNNQAEIIPGVIADPRMGDRVQVIMILTGLGATPVEVPTLQKRAAVPAAHEIGSTALPLEEFQAETHTVEYASMRNDLDIPAFLRRRVR